MTSMDKTKFGKYGGMFIPETLVAPVLELAEAFENFKNDDESIKELHYYFREFAGRPTPLTEIKNFQKLCNGPRVFLKREDLLHTGAHKINHALGQCLLAKKMGKKRILAETGAGQHGVATATAAASLGLDCVIYMGAYDMQRQAPNVLRMRLLGAEVRAAESGQKTLKEAVNEAMRDWSATYETSHYCLGSALGPYPFPQIVAFFQEIIGLEAKEQCIERTGSLPSTVVACVGGGSNAIGIFQAFLDEKTKLVGVEAGGKTVEEVGQHAARFQGGKLGVLHGCMSYVLQDPDGQIEKTDSISAGLDYPMIGPQHAYLNDIGRVKYTYATDQEALTALKDLARTEGIIAAMESAHAVAYYQKHAQDFDQDDIVIINLSGRGDKDLDHIKNHFEAIS